VLYVSPVGSGNICSKASPCSLTGGRDQVRRLKSNMTDDIVVYLRAGTYQLEVPFTLDATDSGSDRYYVIYQAYRDERPVLSGGRTITGWSIADEEKSIWKADIGRSFQTRQLYVNGRRAIRARSAGGLAGASRTPTGYTTTDSRIGTWGNPQDVEFVYRVKWSETRCGVSSISGTTITMKQPCFANATTHTFGPTIDTPTYIENAYELLDQPGEWYLDRSSGTLYYLPRASEELSTANVVAPVLERLVRAAGTLDKPIHHIRFSGITFAYATWLRPSGNDGFAEVQANFTFTGPRRAVSSTWAKTPGNLTFRAAHHVSLVCNRFTHLGAAGLTFEYGSRDNIIAGNVFTDISATAIQVGDVDDPFPPPNQQSVRNQVVNNHIHDLPVEYHGGVGIWTGFVANTVIAHNKLENLSYSRISNGWGWSSPSYSAQNRITRNLIHDHMQLLYDGGGIYSNGSQGTSLETGELVEGNVIYNQAHPYGGIYLDDGSRYVTVTNNLIYNTPHAIFQHNTLSPNVIRENYTSRAATPASVLAEAGLEPEARVSEESGCAAPGQQ
jgi:Right handed beta helix region